jgi:hypothetical protein
VWVSLEETILENLFDDQAGAALCDAFTIVSSLIQRGKIVNFNAEDAL